MSSLSNSYSRALSVHRPLPVYAVHSFVFLANNKQYIQLPLTTGIRTKCQFTPKSTSLSRGINTETHFSRVLSERCSCNPRSPTCIPSTDGQKREASIRTSLTETTLPQAGNTRSCTAMQVGKHWDTNSSLRFPPQADNN